MEYGLVKETRLESNNNGVYSVDKYAVRAAGINEHWGLGGKRPDAEKISNWLRDFHSEREAQAFINWLKGNVPLLENLKAGNPVTILGVPYQSTFDKGPDNRPTHYVPQVAIQRNEPGVYQAVATWEIDRYLRVGEVSPSLASNAMIEQPPSLSPMERENLLRFAENACRDPSFKDFRYIETAYYRDMGARVPDGVNFRDTYLDDMPKPLQDFVRTGMFPQDREKLEYTIEAKKIDGDVVVPAGTEDAELWGVYLKGISEHWGVNGKDPDAKNLKNHLYDFPSPAAAYEFVSQLEAERAKILPAVERHAPVTILGVTYQPKVPAPSHDYRAEGSRYSLPDVASWEIRRYALTGELSPALAANALVGDTNKLSPFQKEALQHFAEMAQTDPSLSSFRKLESAYYKDSGGQLPENVNLRVFTVDDVKVLRDFVLQQSTPIENLLHEILKHPAVQEYQKMQTMPHMPERAKAMYADSLLRNYPELSEKIEAAKVEARTLGTAPITVQQKIAELAKNFPDLEAGISGNLASTLRQSVSVQPTIRNA